MFEGGEKERKNCQKNQKERKTKLPKEPKRATEQENIQPVSDLENQLKKCLHNVYRI